MDKRVNGTIKPLGRARPQREVASKASIREERLQILVECVSDTIALIDLQGRLLFTSSSSLQLLGLSPERLRGRTIYELIHGADSERLRQLLALAGEVDEIATCEFRMRHANGNSVWVEMRSQRARCGNQDEIVAVLRDISARHRQELVAEQHRHHLEEQVKERSRQLEAMVELLQQQIEAHKRDKEALEQSELRYTTLVENTLTGIYIHDGRKMIFCNERFAQIFGFDRDCLESMNTDEQMMDGRSVETLLSGVAQDELVEGRTCDGKMIWLKVSRARIVQNSQNMVIGNVIDITEQVTSNKRLSESREELHTLSALLMAAQESERKRIANELHDGLGQRLSAIKFAVENVWRTTDAETFPEQASQLGAIVESIRDSIEEVRRVSMDLRPTILDDLGLIATIGWFCREFTLLFPNIGVHRNISVGESDIPDEVKVVIFRIIQEAFHNITKHAQADQIELELLSHGNTLYLIIRDNGCGISQLDRSPCAKGLGLKSMRERAELSHGNFRIDSAAGRGTVISVQWQRT